MSKKRKSAVKLAGTVEKIIPEQFSSEPEKAEIAVDTADPLYREIRIENKLQDENGDEVALKPGAQVDVIIEAEPEATDPKRVGKSDQTRRSQNTKAEGGNGKSCNS